MLEGAVAQRAAADSAKAPQFRARMCRNTFGCDEQIFEIDIFSEAAATCVLRPACVL